MCDKLQLWRKRTLSILSGCFVSKFPRERKLKFSLVSPCLGNTIVITSFGSDSTTKRTHRHNFGIPYLGEKCLKMHYSLDFVTVRRWDFSWLATSFFESPLEGKNIFQWVIGRINSISSPCFLNYSSKNLFLDSWVLFGHFDFLISRLRYPVISWRVVGTTSIKPSIFNEAFTGIERNFIV